MFFRHNPSSHASVIARAVTTACRPDGRWPGPCCRPWLEAVLAGLLHGRVAVDRLDPIAPTAVREALPTTAQRLELIELMLSLVMLCNPIPEGLCDSVEHWASCLEVETAALLLVRDLVAGRPRRATADWFRLSWWGRQVSQDPEGLARLRKHGVMAYALTFEADPEEAARWHGLQRCPQGSLGCAMHALCGADGMAVPGEVGAVEAHLAVHDWVHLITNLPRTPTGEIATAAYIAAASDTEAAMLAFLGTLSVFEASLLHYHTAMDDPAHAASHPPFQGALSTPEAIQLVVRCITHGLICPVDPVHGIDYFALADVSLPAIRRQWRLPAEGL